MEIEELKQKRQTIKGAITRIHSFCSGQDAAINDIKVRIKKLEDLFLEYERTQDDIDALASSNDATKELKYRTEIEDKYFETQSIYLNKLQAEEANKPVAQNQAKTSPDIAAAMTKLAENQSAISTMIERMSSNDSRSTQTTEEIRLPQIQIPEFDGSFKNWLRFRDLFEKIIDSRKNLSDIEKFEYLQSKLTGDALSLIKHLTSSNDNYKIAWEVLKKRFNKNEQIKRYYFETLLLQPAIKFASVSEVKRTYGYINESINALKALKEPVEHWDSLLLFLLEKKLDTETLTLWYRKINSDDNTTLEQFMQFLEQRLFELEATSQTSNYSAANNNSRQHKTGMSVQKQPHAYTAMVQVCPACNESHGLYACDRFKALDINERQDLVRSKNLCFNCFNPNHRASQCQRSSCKTCGGKHNTLLHKLIAVNLNHTFENQTTHECDSSENVNTTIVINSAHQCLNTLTFLPTAIVSVVNKSGDLIKCRALLDSGAQVSLISESCLQRLNLKRCYDKTQLFGVGSNSTSYTRGKVAIKIDDTTHHDYLNVQAYCLSKLTQWIPSQKISSSKLDYFKNLKLADDSFNIPSSIDLILGADVFFDCILQKRLVHPSGFPTAIETIFGWVIMGKVENMQTQTLFAAHVTMDISQQLQNFWEIESIETNVQDLSEDEILAENHFKEHTYRDDNGRYVVRLPFKNKNLEFRDSEIAALKRLQAMEAKFGRDKKLEVEYKRFMDEYLSLGHMESIEDDKPLCFYLPHHAVMKPSSSTTKLRVVFDASCKSANGISLNDELLVGPTVQRDLFSILMMFRKFEVAFTSDVEKMYRQVIIHKDDRDFQRIIWRNNTYDSPQHYNLTTVTYGTACAPFLATRTLLQVAFDNEKQFPNAAKVIKNAFYVDDFMFGSEDILEAMNLRTELCEILGNAGFHLRKWCSNSPEFLDSIEMVDRESTSQFEVDGTCTKTVKTLGLLWDTTNDSFKFKVELEILPEVVTKRLILSEIAKIFDPLGLLSPTTIMLKILMQKLWLNGVNWDQQIPDDLRNQWLQYRSNLQDISKIEISRWLQFKSRGRAELHGFSDASEWAYAGAVYLKMILDDGTITTNLITAKTKVAPVKQITLPRLELCGAQLLVKLMKKTQKALELNNVEMFGYTDSTIVLAWISDHPRRWKTFVANRTSVIIDILPPQQWRHVSSHENPADLATRGIFPSNLIKNKLWWHGPNFLKGEYQMPDVPWAKDINLDRREEKNIYIVTATNVDILDRYSEFMKLIRIVALLLRFSQNCRSKVENRNTSFLQTKELKHAHDTIVRQVQQKFYGAEIRMLKAGKQLSKPNALATLAPFIDDTGLMRVGGRIDNANVTFEQKHPIILPKDSHFVKIMVAYYHNYYLHAGTRQLHYLIALKYWVPYVGHVIKGCVYRCVTCMRFRQQAFQQQMGNIPQHRFNMTFAFEHTGVDFAGPIQIRSWKGRGSKLYKCWVALFICLVTKAIHLEIVTDLSAATFLASLKRFVARRGRPSNIYSDNGTNFVGSNQYLIDVIQFLKQQETQANIIKETGEQGINWHFTPPSGPHFGGMWEAGVKSVKFHLRRVLGETSATFEEMLTILNQIESCLNSRPLCLKFEGDEDPITPAHFLIMRPMLAIPDHDYSKINDNHLSRWQFLQKLVQQFWRKWSVEYLHQLQQRPKWAQKLKNLEIGTVVLIKDDDQPPTKWQLGKVVQTYPGSDGLVRVASVKTSKGIFKRPIVKLCPLLIDC